MVDSSCSIAFLEVTMSCSFPFRSMYLIIDANNRLGKNESKNAYLVEREMVDEVIARIRFLMIRWCKRSLVSVSLLKQNPANSPIRLL